MATQTSKRWRSAHARAAEGDLNLDLVKAELDRVRKGVLELRKSLDLVEQLKLDTKLLLLDSLIVIAKPCFKVKTKSAPLGKLRSRSAARRSRR